MARILVTGPSGFIGSALISALVREGIAVRAVYRTLPAHPIADDNVAMGDFGSTTDWRCALDGITEVVHLAGPAHRSASKDTYRREIVDVTSVLAAQAEAAGVRRFLFMSSIAAVAEGGGPFTEAEIPRPMSAYGRAKLEAEARVLAAPALAPVILRPPLVHAPDAKANFALLLRLAAIPAPLPLGGFTNKRSVIARDSLVEATLNCLAYPRGPSGVFHVADRPALSTSEIIAALRRGLGLAPNLFSAPSLAFVPRVMRQSLEIDDAQFRATYRFKGLDSRDALAETARNWKARL